MKNIIDEILELFDSELEKATFDFKELELKRKSYREKLIKLFENNDKL